MAFVKATVAKKYLKLYIHGPAGSGKSTFALMFADVIASKMGKRIAVIDSENNSSAKYADLCDFDVDCDWAQKTPEEYIKKLSEFASNLSTYGILIIDQISSAWHSIKNRVDSKVSAGQDQRKAWGDVSNLRTRLEQAITDGPYHTIVLARGEIGSIQTDDGKNIRDYKIDSVGKLEYAFDVSIRLKAKDGKYTAVVMKSRFRPWAGKVFTDYDVRKLAEELWTWLDAGGDLPWSQSELTSYAGSIKDNADKLESLLTAIMRRELLGRIVPNAEWVSRIAQHASKLIETLRNPAQDTNSGE